MVHSSSGLPEPNTALNDARRHIKELKRRRKRMPKKISKEEWEKRINEAGAGRYDFVRWAVDGEFGSQKKCVIGCVKDGYEWSSTVSNLVNGGQGCQKCAGNGRRTAEERTEQINKLENIEFISWVDGYKNAFSKVNVKCEIDGFVWSPTVNDLVHGGHGCPQCAGLRRWAAEERIEHINNIENIEFVSWVGSYKNQKSKANVRCKVDGFIWMASVNSIVHTGSGCPQCSNHGYDSSKEGFLYALRSECGQYVKIGISNDPKRRHKELERGTPFRFNLVEQLSGDGTKIAELEKYFHDKYDVAGFTGYDGATEWLVCTPQLLEELRTIGDK